MDITYLSDVLDQVVKRLDQTQNLEYKLDQVMKRLDTVQEKQDLLEDKFSEMSTRLEQMHAKLERCIETRLEQVNTKLERCIETTTRSTDTAKDDLLKDLTNSDVTQTQDWMIKTSMASLAGNLDTMEKNMAAVVQKIESVETSLISVKEGQDQLITNVKRSTNEVKDDIDRSKREIFAVTEKEAQIVRDRIEGPLSSQGKYTFELCLDNFKTLVRSGEEFYSLPCHINEMKSCVMGGAVLTDNGEMYVCLSNGRHPLKVGLKPVSGVRLKVKATICDFNQSVLQDEVVGEETVNAEEDDRTPNFGWGCTIGVTSCDDLIQKGYGGKEEFDCDTVLIRYDVTVL